MKNPRPQSGEEWFGQYKKIDTPTFIYEEFNPMVDDSYGECWVIHVQTWELYR
ncbi:hypothetical protein M3629_06230 [Paenibacillus polysaccharolyticus]|nr:hypothetical protein [Paenibacillus polysaccharolyticus]